MKLEKNKLFVDFHEWAWSLRTCGFPIFAILKDGEVVKIGETRKKPTVYKIPKETVAILREYVSNSGLTKWFIYTMPSLQEYIVGDRNNWDTSELPDNLQSIIEKLVEKYLATDP
jgi:hypothetical protein